jgi:hypothetical protein
MKDQQNTTLTNEQFNLLAALIDTGIKAAGLQAVSNDLPGAVQAFAALKPEPEAEE